MRLGTKRDVREISRTSRRSSEHAQYEFRLLNILLSKSHETWHQTRCARDLADEFSPETMTFRSSELPTW